MMNTRHWFVTRKAAVILLALARVGGNGETLSLTLHQAVRLSLQQNPDLRRQAYDVQASEKDVATAGLRPNPELTLIGDVLAAGLPGDSSGSLLQPKNKYFGASLSIPVEMGGKRTQRIASAEQGKVLSRTTLEETQRQTALAVANAWLDVYQAELTLTLNLKAKALLDTVVTVNQTRLRNQVITSTDLTRSMIAARQYEAQVAEAMLQASRARRALALLLGRGASDSVEVDMGDTLDPAPSMSDSILQSALEKRSDIRLANTAVQAAGANYGLQKALAVPDFNLNLDFSEQQSVPFYGLSLVFPLPVFSRNQGEIGKAEIARQQAEFARAALRRQVESEINSAYEEYRAHQHERELSELNLKESEQVLQTVEYSYRTGNTTILDFMDAQRTWFDARQACNDAWIAHKRSGVLVAAVLGGLF